MRDPAVHRAVCDRVSAWVAAQPGWNVVGIAESPIQGPAGNREFLLYARRGCRGASDRCERGHVGMRARLGAV